MRNNTILVADSDTSVAGCIAEALAARGYSVRCHTGGRLTLEAIAQAQPGLVILEQWPAGPDLTPLLERLPQHHATRAVAVIVSSTDPWALAALAAPLQARGWGTLPKPFELDTLFARVAAALGGWSQPQDREQERQYV